MTENYEVTKQILKQSLEVKLKYERIIQKAMLVKDLRRGMRKIIRQESARSSSPDKTKEEED